MEEEATVDQMNHEMIAIRVGLLEFRAAQMNHRKLHNGVIGWEIDIIAQRIDICPAFVLIKSSYNYKSRMFLLSVN